MVEDPPETWKTYKEKGDDWGIVEMELREAKTAKVQAKADPGKKPEAIKELAHVAGAVLNLMIAMQEDK